MPLVCYADASIGNAEKVALDLLKREHPTAVFGGNDVLAVSVIQATRALNLVIPEDISIIGLNNTFLCEIVSPQLTTISMPVKEISYRAIDLLIEKIEKESALKTAERFSPSFVERVSAEKLKK